jgi:hypothetical protein
VEEGAKKGVVPLGQSIFHATIGVSCVLSVFQEIWNAKCLDCYRLEREDEFKKVQETE